MKRFLITMAIFMVAATGMSLRAAELPIVGATLAPDTIIIKLPNGAAMNLIVKNTRQLKSFKDYKLDSLMVILNKYVEQVEAMEKANRYKEAKSLTMTFYPAKDLQDPSAPEQITISVSASSVKKMHEDAKTPGIIEGIKIFVEHQEKQKANRDSSTTVDHSKRNKNRRSKFVSNLDLGLNAFTNIPGGSGDLFDLRPRGSRYVSLNQHFQHRLGGKTSPVYLVSGVELAFNNYMFDKNRYIVDNNGVTQLVKETTRNFEKSKLATSAIQIPLMLHLRLRDDNGKKSFKLGAGGFVGYRLGSHSKLKYNLEGSTEKDKDRGSYNLEDLQYGVNFSIGYRDFELFTKYNMNDLFKDGRGPKLNVISFGFRL